ncbi:MAG: endonuclease [Oscillospiraceae bacterium]|nr:endonuclease [Oscillospiraceae bacterium]
MKKILKALLILILVVVAAVALLFGWLTAVEYMPDAEEAAEVKLSGDVDRLKPGQPLTILSWNIGYAGLGKDSDFFMDGGKDTRSADRETVGRYLEGIRRTIDEQNADLVILQEVDSNSYRTYSIDERTVLDRGMSCETFALNYSCPFVPIPMPPIGKVHSGLYTMTDGLTIERAERISLPCPFTWPTRVANLKRCLLVSYLPIEGSDKQLVLVNLHLEAYDDGEGKIAQTNQLRDFITAEYEKGNYVIAGGDFNQVFPGSLTCYPNTHPENWEPGVLDIDMLPQGWQLAYDLGTPTCRLLNQPYDPSDTVGTQYYVIDGLILSPNVTLESAETVDAKFENSDHNPVKVEVVLN